MNALQDCTDHTQTNYKIKTHGSVSVLQLKKPKALGVGEGVGQTSVYFIAVKKNTVFTHLQAHL